MAEPTNIHSTPSSIYVQALQWGGWHWTGGTINYYFNPAGTNLESVFTGAGTSLAWNSTEMAAYQAALQTWANVANITFTQQSTYSGADLVAIVSGAGLNALGIHETPEGAAASDGTAWGAFNNAGEGWTTAGLQSGGYGFITLIHEIGHGLGLAHPHDDGGGSPVFPGVTTAFGDYGDHDLNQGIFTVMSYNDGWPTGPLGASQSDIYGWQATPMAFDIAAIQALYGANYNYHSGSDTYYLPGSNGAGTTWSCIWDAGGSDGIYYTGSGNAVISLQAATLDHNNTGGGVPSYVVGVIGGFTIANGVFIETASGGSGNDTISGNDSYNYLYGNGGSDTIYGGGGEDVVVGDTGNDTLYGGDGGDVLSELAAGSLSGDDTLYGGNGIDIMYSGDGYDIVYGGIDADTANNYGNLGNDDDTYYGSGGTDVVVGGNGNDTINGNSGDDSLYGEVGNDTINGGAGIDLLSGGLGIDTLNGGADNDLLVGDEGNDILIGGLGIDVLYGGAENDILTGNAGTDALYGGAGNDRFQVGGVGFEADYIYDFVGGAGVSDQLVFQGSIFGSAPNVRAAASSSGGNTTITIPGTGGLTYVVLVGVANISALNDDDFAFGGSF